MSGLLTVTTPAASRLLTTPAAALAELGLDAPPPRLPALLAQASSAIAAHCGRVWGRETVQEVFRLDRVPANPLPLARWPVAGVPVVTEDGAALAAGTDWELDGPAGLLWRLGGDARTPWRCNKVVVAYTAGWLLPGQDGRDLPEAVERACLLAVAAAWHAAGRDPALRSESTEGVGSASYLDPREGAGGLPAAAAELLAPFRVLRA